MSFPLFVTQMCALCAYFSKHIGLVGPDFRDTVFS